MEEVQEAGGARGGGPTEAQGLREARLPVLQRVQEGVQFLVCGLVEAERAVTDGGGGQQMQNKEK